MTGAWAACSGHTRQRSGWDSNPRPLDRKFDALHKHHWWKRFAVCDAKWALKSRDLTTRHQIKHIATGWTCVGPRKNRTCWTISELNPVCHDSTAALIVACSFCVHAVSHSVGAHTESLQPRVNNSSNSKLQRGRRREQANSRGVGIGNGSRGNNLGRLLRSVHRGATCWPLVPCGHRTRRQYTRRRNDDTENF